MPKEAKMTPKVAKKMQRIEEIKFYEHFFLDASKEVEDDGIDCQIQFFNFRKPILAAGEIKER